ncbi:hypothetical protein SAMN04487770_13129 [Butyrivibrio sp. ob235]|uniref:hypothetical protein n=1 Tax=Butyrivibrio sp. ob235 TaxID=1761780 RepID=UPI0008AC8E3A|nr:hypothetical protein [Butyrivibrio sp. ob235]SEM26675.1 hypothetical protein SAMN04487770_13129 [Butyrivibrio sp. ob235]
MQTLYTERPANFSQISPFVSEQIEEINESILINRKIFFYDTCSFRYHSNFKNDEQKILTDYFKSADAAIFITRCILMELASISGELNEEYVAFFRLLSENGIRIFVLDEEKVFNILSECFSDRVRINDYLTWAVRMLNKPVSTIRELLENDVTLYKLIIEGKNHDSSSIYQRFFRALRSAKEQGDNLGEEILSIVIQILSHLPGTADGKYCLITDDRNAAGQVATQIINTGRQHAGARIIIYSTPKLVQTIYNLRDGITENNMIKMLSVVFGSNVRVSGLKEYDFEIDYDISLAAADLARLIMKPNGIKIVF